jgi:hypothetical protein
VRWKKAAEKQVEKIDSFPQERRLDILKSA